MPHTPSTAMPFDAALERMREVAQACARAPERVALARAHGGVLAQALVAPIALQPFDNSAMDGFALRHADLGTDGASLDLVGEQFAGPDAGLELAAGQCVRITTGAPMPRGADTVAIKERVVVSGGRVQVPLLPAGANVRKAGEDAQPGDHMLDAGTRLTAAHVSLAAALGIDTLLLAPRPTVAVFSTGDELVAPGMALQPGQIYDSNRELLMGLVRAQGLEPTAWPVLPDEPGRMHAMLADACAAFDVVITCGGVSAGERDLLPRWLADNGSVHVWKVAMKPGMPLLFGQAGRALLLGLPGNPVSVLATFLALGVPLLDALQGALPRAPLYARLALALHKPHARREFLRGSLRSAGDGSLLVIPHSATGSHRLAAAALCDALIDLPEGPQTLQPGDAVAVLPYGSWP